MLKMIILYSSSTGNTEKMAKAIAEGAKNSGNEVKLAPTHNFLVNPEELSKFDVIFVGTPTYHHDLPNEIKQLFENTAVKGVSLKGKIGAVFGSYGWTGEAPKLLTEIIEHKFEMQTVDPPLASKYAPDQKMLDLCKTFGKRVSESAKVKSAPKQEAKENIRFVCRMCGCVYDPALGDPKSKIPAETTFRELPEKWVCPDCGAKKDQFARTHCLNESPYWNYTAFPIGFLR